MARRLSARNPKQSAVQPVVGDAARTPPAIGYHLQSEQNLTALGKPEVLVITREIGHDAWNRSGANFDAFAALGVRVICRLNHGSFPLGTLPFSQNYGAFSRRCANFVAASSGCHTWIIGNEPNFRYQWPTLLADEDVWEDSDASVSSNPPAVEQAAPLESARSAPESRSWMQRIKSLLGVGLLSRWADPARRGGANAQGKPDVVGAAELDARYTGPPRFSAVRGGSLPKLSGRSAFVETITPRKYAGCYRLCRRAIRALPGHEHDVVLPAGLAPYTNHAAYAANPDGDWVTYFRHLIGLLTPNECDGLALHVYGVAASGRRDADGATSLRQQALTALCAHIPDDMASLPVFLTECGETDGWVAAENGWLDRLLADVEEACAKRITLPAVVALANGTDGPASLDAPQALTIGLSTRLQPWISASVNPHATPVMTPFRRQDFVVTTTVVNLRRSPGHLNKSADDIVAELAGGVRLEILSDRATPMDSLSWWHVRIAYDGTTPSHEGWVAQNGQDGRPLLTQTVTTGIGAIRRGLQVRTLLPARIRRSAGYLGKPDNDVLGEASADSLWRVVGGPTGADDLTWWEIAGTSATGPIQGWVAETAPGGLQLLTVADGNTAGGEKGAGGEQPEIRDGRFRPGDRVVTLAYARLRRTPGLLNKHEDDVIADIWLGADVLILAGPRPVDDLLWYDVQASVDDGTTRRGWMAETAPGGLPILGMREVRFEEEFALGELSVAGSSPLRVRRSPGVNGKPDDDVLGEFYSRTTLNVLSRVQRVDDMRWWRVGGIATHGAVRGWVAQSTLQGVALLRRPPRLPGTSIPDRVAGHFLGRPFAGRFGISQMWGENPRLYARFTYDGVRLIAHNGIDFLTPTGTPILATAPGVVGMAGFEAGGFGHYVLLEHAWGQSIYAHMDSIAVQNGQSVAAGQTLGYSGNTGNSFGPHLHFAIRIHPYVRGDGWGGFSDPLPYMASSDVILPAYVQDETVRDVWPPALLDLLIADPPPPPGMVEETPGMVRP